MVSFDAFDVVVVPFPFTDLAKAKRRPALVLSEATRFNDSAGHSVMAMITSAHHSAWPLDVGLRDLEAAGLSARSVVRMKLFTLDHRLVLRRAGRLATIDSDGVRAALARLLGASPR